MSESLCLQWNDFKENALGTLGSLKNDHDFLDVTLASEDGKQVEANKMILAISSPFFQNLLKKNKHPHPLIYMRGVKSIDLLAIVDFLYFGEANVYQENLDSFLALAEELQLKGLMGKSSTDEEIQTRNEIPFQEKESKITNCKPMKTKPSPVLQDNSNANVSKICGRTVATKNYFSGNFHELDEKCNSMMGKTTKMSPTGQPLYRCEGCGKEAQIGNLKNHIEAKHLEGITIPCNFCEKTFRVRNTLKQHMAKDHQESHPN